MMKLNLQLRATKKYPKKGEYIALIHSPKTLKLVAWDRNEKLYDDMSGLTIGITSKLYFYGSTPTIEIQNCIIDNEISKGLFGSEIIAEADKCLVLDVLLSNGEQEVNIKELPIEMSTWLKNMDVFANMEITHSSKNQFVYDAFCDFFELDKLIEEPQNPMLDEEVESEDLYESFTEFEKSNLLSDWLMDGMPDEKLDELQDEFIREEIVYLIDENPKLFLAGNGYKKIAIASDLIFSIDEEGDVLYLKPLCREFFLACSYFGSEIEVISATPLICKKMLDACDLPYFNVINEISSIKSYDSILTSNAPFLGYNQIFQRLYGIDSILLVPHIINKDWDSIKRVLNSLYNSVFNYDSFKLNEIINIIKSYD